MLKFIFLIWLLFLSATIANAQKIEVSNINPFGNLQFANSPTDTITLMVNYNNIIGDVNVDNEGMLSVIAKSSGSKIKKMDHAIGFTIPGYPQKFYAPCKDENLFKTLSSKQNSVNKLKLSCIVYRFYYIDDTYNFFYIDRASIAD